MEQTKRIYSQIAVVVGVILVFASYFIGVSAGKNSFDADIPENIQDVEKGKETQVDFSPFWKAWNVLNEKFVNTSNSTTTKKVDDQARLWGAIEGLAASYGDPYTVFFPPVESERFEDEISGNFEGVGMEIALRDGFITVVSPLKNTPAYKAGVLAGDKVIKIDNTTTANMSVEDAVGHIRGEKGTKVKLTITREDEDDFIEIEVTRDVINIPTIDTELKKGVFIIKLYNFSAVSPELFRGALREFAQSGTNKLVLDLRGNPGGYLEAAVDMASWFLPSGKIIVREDFGGKRDEVLHRSRGYNVFSDAVKMVILIDGGSASASEILAGALSENGIAKLVGAKSFGKGSVQELVKLTPETSLKVTIAKWLTPEGHSISDGGLTPDIEVKRTAEEFKSGKDPQLDKALEILNASL